MQLTHTWALLASCWVLSSRLSLWLGRLMRPQTARIHKSSRNTGYWKWRRQPPFLPVPVKWWLPGLGNLPGIIVYIRVTGHQHCQSITYTLRNRVMSTRAWGSPTESWDTNWLRALAAPPGDLGLIPSIYKTAHKTSLSRISPQTHIQARHRCTSIFFKN